MNRCSPTRSLLRYCRTQRSLWASAIPFGLNTHLFRCIKRTLFERGQNFFICRIYRRRTPNSGLHCQHRPYPLFHQWQVSELFTGIVSDKVLTSPSFPARVPCARRRNQQSHSIPSNIFPLCRCLRRRVKKSEALRKRSIMNLPHERQQVGAPADVRDPLCQPRTASTERIPGCGESHFAGRLASPIAVGRSREIHARRDRQAPRAESLGAGGLVGQARHYSCLVPEADRPHVRWIQTPQLSWQTHASI
jgi:hypothetical protein